MDQILKHLNDLDKFIVSRWAYSVGISLMEDAEYNVLYKVIKDTHPDTEYLKRTWSDDPCPVELLRSIGREDLVHKIILGDKTESIPSLNTDLEVYNELSGVNKPATLSMKHDGWNVQVSYYMGKLVMVHTRGRSTDSVDVSKIQSLLPSTIPFRGKCKVVLELTVSKSNFVKCAKLFGNVSNRSAVSSVLARPEHYDLLSFTGLDILGYNLNNSNKFDVLTDWGYSVPRYYNVVDYDDIIEAIKELSLEEENYPEPTDGLVYDSGDFCRAIRLGAWEEPIYFSYVKGYLEQYGPYRISPSVVLFDINRKGTTQHKVSLTNWQRIMQYNLQPGAPIAFRVASSAVADFDEETTKLLHKQWDGRWDEFRETVEHNEELMRLQHIQSISKWDTSITEESVIEAGDVY